MLLCFKLISVKIIKCQTKLWCFTGNATNFRLILSNDTSHEQRNGKGKDIFYPLIQEMASTHANLRTYLYEYYLKIKTN